MEFEDVQGSGTATLLGAAICSTKSLTLCFLLHILHPVMPLMDNIHAKCMDKWEEGTILLHNSHPLLGL